MSILQGKRMILPFSEKVRNEHTGAFFIQQPGVYADPFLSEGIAEVSVYGITGPVLLRWYNTKGDGACFYYCLEFITGDPDCRTVLLQSLASANISDSQRLHLQRKLEDKEEWADTMVLEFASLVYDISIPVYCVAEDTLECIAVYGNGRQSRALILSGSRRKDAGVPWSEEGVFRGSHFSPMAYESDAFAAVSGDEVDSYYMSVSIQTGEVVNVPTFSSADEDEIVEAQAPKVGRIRRRKPRMRARDRWRKKLQGPSSIDDQVTRDEGKPDERQDHGECKVERSEGQKLDFNIPEPVEIKALSPGQKLNESVEEGKREIAEADVSTSSGPDSQLPGTTGKAGRKEKLVEILEAFKESEARLNEMIKEKDERLISRAVKEKKKEEDLARSSRQEIIDEMGIPDDLLNPVDDLIINPEDRPEQWELDRFATGEEEMKEKFRGEDTDSIGSTSSIVDVMRVAGMMVATLKDEEPKMPWLRRKWEEFKASISGYVSAYGHWEVLGSEELEGNIKRVDETLEDNLTWEERRRLLGECLKSLLVQYECEEEEDKEPSEGEVLKNLMKGLISKTGADREALAHEFYERLADLEEAEEVAIFGKDLMDRISMTAQLEQPLGNLIMERESPCMRGADVAIGNYQEFIEIVSKGDEMVWTFTEPSNFNLQGSSMRSMKQTVEIKHSHKIRHNLVCEAISTTNTDITLESVWPTPKSEKEQDENLDDGMATLTPDFIIDRGDHVIVIEVGTFRGHDVRFLTKEYQRKVDRYEAALMFRARADKKIIFVPVIVGVNAVLSGVNLGQDVVNDLLVRMSVGCSIEDLAQSKGINASSRGKDTAKEAMATEILYNIEKIQEQEPKENDDDKFRIFITKKYLNDVRTRKPDMRQVKKLYCESIKRAIMDAKNPPKTFQEAKERLIRKIKTPAYDEKGRPIPFRRDTKAVVMMPMVDPRPTRMCKAPRPHIIVNHPGYNKIATVWEACMRSYDEMNWKDENLQELLEQAMERKEGMATDLSEDQRKMRKKYHRVSYKKLDPTVIKYLEKDGIRAKRAKNDPDHKDRLRQQKRAFDFDTDVSDIEKFIDSSYLFHQSSHSLNDGEEAVMELFDQANKLAGNQQVTVDIMKDWMGTKWYRAMNLIADVATELTISFKQNVKDNEMILKKLSYHDVYMLICPTNSESHIFYSLYFPNDDGALCGIPFRQVVPMGDGYVTEFVSTRADKVVNYLNAPSRFLTIAAFFADFFNLDIRDKDECIGHVEFKKMVNFSMLVSLENKASAEECITATRYMYQQLFKTRGAAIRPCPQKMLEKLPTVYRSRLALYVAKKIILHFERMNEELPELKLVNEPHDMDCDDSVPGDRWDGLLNCFTGAKIQNSSSAVQLMYIGYFKDKQEKAQRNTEEKMVYKIVEAEETIDPDDPAIFGEMNELPKPGKGSKNFSLDCIIYGTNLLEERFRREIGPQWQRTIVDSIVRKLTGQLTHELATLKASCMEDHNDVDREVSDEDKRDVMRCKVLEALAVDIKSFGTNPMTKLDDILKYIEESSSGVICDLFKKCQHGGLREIYVLTIRSRLIQLALEVMARVICSQVPEETLTHPENKLRTLDEHKKKCQRYAHATNQSVVNICSSSDKKTWNQEFTMVAMCVPLIRLLPQSFHGFIQRALNLWANKLIKLPASVIESFERNVDLSSQTYKTVKDEFNGIKKTKVGLFRKKRSPFLNLTSGMMQGILHYTSSLLHLTFLAANKALMTNAYYHSYKCKNRIAITSVCSSDDSATILSMFHSSEEKTKSDLRSFVMASILLEASVHFCRAFCMIESIKSVIGALNSVEFNSEFVLQNTLASPYIKYVAAMLNFTQSQSHIKASHERYNLMSAAYQNGFPALSTHFCQIAQLIMHYKALGSGSSALFVELKDRLLKFPDPVHGYFLIDSERAPGFGGFSFCLYKAITNGAPKLGQSLKFLSKVEPEAGPDGVSVQSLNIKHGNLERWVKMIDRVCEGSLTDYKRSARSDTLGKVYVDREALKEKISIINKDPQLFLTDPTNNEEVRVKLIMKASSYGVADSLTRGNPIIQAFASTAYGLFTPCYVTTTLTRQAAGDELTKSTAKVSLLRSLQDQIDRLERDPVDSIDLEKHFPLIRKYRELDEIITQYADAEEISCKPFRKKKSYLNFGSSTMRLPVPLLDCLRYRWYGKECRYSKKVVEHCLEQYRMRFPWILDSAEDTLDKSPFENYNEMFGFLSHSDCKSRNFVRLGPRIKAASFAGQVHQLIRRSFKNKVILQVYGRKRDRIPFNETFRDQQCRLDLALNYPMKEGRDSEVTMAMAAIAGTIPSTSEEKKIHTIATYMTGELSSKELINKIHSEKLAPFICFPVEQRRIEGADGKTHWRGRGECVATMGKLVVKIYLVDEDAKEIVTNDILKLRKDPGLVRDILNRIDARVLTTIPNEDYLDQRDRQLSCVFSGLSFRPRQCAGTPVFFDELMEGVLIYPDKLEVRIGYRLIGINYTEKGSHPVNILSYRTKDRDLYSFSFGEPQEIVVDKDGRIKKKQKVIPSGNIVSNWVNVRPVQRSNLMTLACELFKEEIEERLREQKMNPMAIMGEWTKKYRRWQNKDVEKQRTILWMKDTFRKRVTELGIPVQRNFSDVIEISEDIPEADEELMEMIESEMLEWMKEGDDKGFKFDFGEAMEPGITGNDHKEDMVDALVASIMPMEQDLEVLNFNYTVAGKVNQSVIESKIPNAYAKHPLWDNFIEELESRSRDFIPSAIQGKVNPDVPLLSIIIQVLMGVGTENVLESLDEGLKPEYDY